jgi:hypothetical protein
MKDRPALLIVDGHNSRLNPHMLVDAVFNHVVVLCLPSHLTHLLQPNDSGYNKAFKSNLSNITKERFCNQEVFSRLTLAQAATEALAHRNMPDAIRHSFEHCGIFPFNRGKVDAMIASETVRHPKSIRATGPSWQPYRPRYKQEPTQHSRPPLRARACQDHRTIHDRSCVCFVKGRCHCSYLYQRASD